MIRYSLACEKGHQFESWFQSSDAFDSLKAAGHVACAACGSTKVSKTLMAPAVKPADKVPIDAAAPDAAALEAKLKRLRSEIEAHADDVGDRFATEARAMYLGDIPDRPIYGQAKPDEAKGLIEDGVPVLPLPFTPRKQTH